MRRKKPRLKPNRFHLYNLAERCVRDGIETGWNRAHKHDDKPPMSTIFEKQTESAMLNLSKEIDFGLE